MELRLTVTIAVILWGASRGEAMRAEDGTDGWLSRQCKQICLGGNSALPTPWHVALMEVKYWYWR